LAIFPAPDSQSTKKSTERDLKLLFSRAHSTNHQTSEELKMNKKGEKKLIKMKIKVIK